MIPLPSGTFPRFIARCAAASALALGLAGCMGIDIASVQRIEAGNPAPAAGMAVATGRIRHVVDGQALDYGLLTKPHLSLLHQQRGVLMSSPETQADGSFRWQLPAGDYSVAVLFGGMSPTRQPLRLPSGSVIRVNGIVQPGAGFRLAPGAVVDLGTLVVDIESRPSHGTLFGSGPVFGRLRALRVEPSPGQTPDEARRAWVMSPLHALADAGTDPAEPGLHPGVLAPLLPLLIR